MKLPLFPAGVVGSMPRSQFVRDLLAPERRRTLSEEEFRRRLDAAVAYIIAVQEGAGVDIVSDGEWRRLSYIGVIAEIMHGFERTIVEGRYWHTVVEKMAPRAPGLVAEEAAFLKAHTDRCTKVALPSPYLLGQRMWDPERSKKAYPTREAFMEALVPVLRRELLAVRDAGVTVVQFDDPHLCLFVDDRVRRQYEDADREVDYCVGLLNDIIDGVDGVTRAIHLCRRNKGRDGWVGEGGYGPILPALQRLKVDQYMMEFAIPAAGDFDVLRQLPERAVVGVGCVDVRGTHVDTPEEIAARVERALAYLPPERVALNPDCGFAPGNAADIPIDEAYAKLSNEAKAASFLRGKYG